MKGRDGRPWRRIVAMAKRELPPVCHLCGGIIDMGLHWNDAMSWTLDHVNALKNGGAPETLANLRPAHRSCNSRKGAKKNYAPPQRPRQSRIW